MKRLSLVAGLIAASLILAGCPTVASDAYKTVVAAKAFLDDQKAKHGCATIGDTSVGNMQTGALKSSMVCTALFKAVAAKDLLVDAGEAYCGGPQFATGGACQPPAKGTPAEQQAAAKLATALSNYKVTEKDLRGVLGL